MYFRYKRISMNNRPVGIFDSGLGGLSALRVLRQLLPEENIVYFGDTGRNPYGVRSPEELRRMAREDMELAASFGAKAIIAACGTVSSTAPDVLASFRLPVFNVIDASVAALAAVPGDAPLGVIATSASIKNGAFKRRLQALCPGREIVDAACQDFVRLIEHGHTDENDAELIAAVEGYLAPLKARSVCALLLGCTHFDFAEHAIKIYIGRDVRIVSASGCAAQSMCGYLREHDLLGAGGTTEYYTSGSAESFTANAGALLGQNIAGHVHTASAEGKAK